MATSESVGKRDAGNPPLERQDIWVLSLGGSLIFPDTIDIAFLRGFRECILKMTKKGHRFVIVTGGGALCRVYQRAAAEIVDVHPDDLDWIGVHVTRINAHLMRTLFRDVAHRKVIKDPHEPFDFTEGVLMVAGWKPGWSTDYDAVLLAKRLGSGTVINLSNINYMYDKDPHHSTDAKPITSLSWDEFLKITGTEWSPGLNTPFDPVASKEASKEKMRVIITSGRDLDNLERIITGKPFDGTLIG